MGFHHVSFIAIIFIFFLDCIFLNNIHFNINIITFSSLHMVYNTIFERFKISFLLLLSLRDMKEQKVFKNIYIHCIVMKEN